MLTNQVFIDLANELQFKDESRSRERVGMEADEDGARLQESFSTGSKIDL